MSVRGVLARCAFNSERVDMQLDGACAASFEVQAVHVLSHNVTISAFGSKQNLESSQCTVRDVRLRAGKLLKADQASDPISLPLRIVGHEFLVRNGTMVGVAHISAIATSTML